MITKISENQFHFSANMGSCQCGDINTTITLDYATKTVFSEADGSYRWMNGKIESRYSYFGSSEIVSQSFKIPYVSEELPLEGIGWKLVITR